MRAILPAEVAICNTLFARTTYVPSDFGALLRPEWAAQMGCEVVPVESAGRIPAAQIQGLSSALSHAGYRTCYAIPSEQLGADDPALMIETTTRDFNELNHRLGVFQFIIVPDDATWAIACNVWFNLFGAKPNLLREMISAPVSEARDHFESFANFLGGSIPKVAALYRSGAPLDQNEK